MILKNFELKKEKIDKFNFFLLYGGNKGFIEEVINKNLKPLLSKNIFNYDEDEILKNLENFKENLLNKSFFEDDKLIIISRTTDKIIGVIEDLIDKNIENISFILIADILEKKSKVRNFFEKNKKAICVPFYEDNNQTLTTIAQKFFREKQISISSQNINLIVGRTNGDRINLKNELKKIEFFCKDKKKVTTEEILKLTNLTENFDISELIDSSLVKNKKKTLNILNENNFVNEDCIIILRIYLTKLKRLLKLKNEIKERKNIDQVISSFKPPIFWKEKEIIKEQVKIWDQKKIEKLILNVNETEFIIKKNPSLSINIVTDFILEKTLEANS